LPSERLIEFINKLEWKKSEEAKEILRVLLKEKWFSDYLSKLIRLRGKMTRNEIIDELGVKIGTKRSRNVLRRLNRLFEWIEYSEIISESTDNTYELKQIAATGEIEKSFEESLKKPEMFSGAEIESPREAQFLLVLAINITPETTIEELKKMIELARKCTIREFIEKRGDGNTEEEKT